MELQQSAGEPAVRPRTRVLVLLALAVLVVAGAVRLAFLCDDAYITFRYVAHAHDGLGLVWNPPPFRPVEGYTSFAWAMLLWAVWSWFGIAPPDAANVLSIACGVLLFGVTALAAFRLRDRNGVRLPDSVAFATLAVLAGNRCFLQWLSGGLETALFNLTFAGWVLLAFRQRGGHGARWLSGWAATAALAALTRPDGLLLAAATGAVAAMLVLRRALSLRRAALGLLPLAAVVAHTCWRHAFYGAWLPNTYFAKTTAPWPEAGLRYLYCFAFENGAWWWLVVAGAALLVAVVQRRPLLRSRSLAHLPAAAAVATTIAHVGYYVLRVGGDHFEYRVLSHVVPLGTLAVPALAARIRPGRWLPLACVAGLGLASSVGWVHLALTRTILLQYDALSDKLPEWLRPLTRAYDRRQAWLQLQLNCCRCRAQARSLENFRASLPERARMTVDAEDLPVVAAQAVGFAGWVLPDCAVLDLLGLNDWVVARSPVPTWNAPFLPKPELDQLVATADADHDGWTERPELSHALAALPGGTIEAADTFAGTLLLLFGRTRDDALTAAEMGEISGFFAHLRFIAHERAAPPDYVQAFDVNVTIADRRVLVRKRAVPLTAERVRAIENEWRQRVERRD